MRRREFIAGLGGTATILFAGGAHAQQRVRRIGVMTGLANEAAGQARFLAFVQALAQLGWTENRNVRIDARWGSGDAGIMRKQAASHYKEIQLYGFCPLG